MTVDLARLEAAIARVDPVRIEGRVKALVGLGGRGRVLRRARAPRCA